MLMLEKAGLFLWFLPFLCSSQRNSESEIYNKSPFLNASRNMERNQTLLLVQVVWRHGDRAPMGTYPTDIHQESSWPNGWGELTERGMRQQHLLGQVLRKRYIDIDEPIINKQYDSKQIYIRSTDVNRTLISAYANLAGMFTSGKAGKDYPDQKGWPSGWTPIPVHSFPLQEDHIGNIFAPCPRATQLDSQLRNSDEFQEIEKNSEKFLQFLSSKTGMKVDLSNVYLINDVHYIETIYNMTQPSWFTPEVSLRLRNLTELLNEYIYGIGKPYLPELIRLRGGSLLRSIVDLMKQKLYCLAVEHQRGCDWIRPLKYYAYSAHDTTVAALLATFGDELEVIRGGLPKYTASVAVELWMLEEEPVVRILFHEDFHQNYRVITHLTKGCPHNKEFCPFKSFVKRSKPFMPINIKKECQQRLKKSDRIDDASQTHEMTWPFV